MPKPRLDPQVVRQLEEQVAQGIANAMEASEDELPIAADEDLLHCMAKAAVTVYEACVHQEAEME